MKKIFLFFSVVILGLFTSGIKAADSSELKDVYYHILEAEVDTSTTVDIVDFTLEHQSLNINFQNGRLSFFKPVTIDSTETYFGAYFRGTGHIKFKPPIFMEKEQLERFIGKDSINDRFDEIFLLFNQDIYNKIIECGFVPSEEKSKDDINRAENLRRHLAKDYNESYFFMTLKSLINPTPHPFLVVNVKPKNLDRIFYVYDPFKREEIKLYKEYAVPGIKFMELVNSYSQYNTDETYKNINGRTKQQIKVAHYDIDASIDRKGIFYAKTKVSFEVLTTPLQLVEFRLDPRLKINSIKDSTGKTIEFVRSILETTFKDYDSYEIDIIFDHPLAYGEKIILDFNYEGEIAERDLGEYYVSAGADWYPKYGYGQRTTFDMKFKTDNDYVFVSSGLKIDEKNIGDTLITTWKVTSPAVNVSFNIGNMKKYLFEESDIVPVEVYYSKNLHNTIGQYLSRGLVATGKDMEKQVAEDVMNAIRVYSQYFGPYPYDRMVVGEILANHGEAFPGFLHLGFDTWINTDKYGNDRIFRAHEVAHQWWGVQVGFETYHDQWLSEGFSDYSALMYYQNPNIGGNNKFLNKLKDIRNDIFSVRKYFLGSGEESGPIALGYRTSSTETKGDYGLIIYKKGAFVLHMLRNMLIDLKTMNEDSFLNMMKEFYTKYRGKNASTSDFQLLAEKYTGVDLSWFFEQWVYGNELPTYNFSYSYENDQQGNYIARGKIITENVSKDFKMYIPLEIQIDNESKAYVRILVDKPVFEFTLPGLPKKPKKIVLNPFQSVLAKVKQ